MSAQEKSPEPAVTETARRIVVKVGSSLLVTRGRLRRRWLAALAADIARLAAAGRQLVIVSSGAVGLGRQTIGDLPRLPERQAVAAVGQVRLAEAYRRALAGAGLATAQILLTPGDTENRRRHLNARGTLEALLERAVVPVINENDTVATEELKFGDNDRLAARVAQLVSAELLVLLSDVDGLYDRDPRRFADARHVAEVRVIDRAIESMAAGAGSALGTGGMAAKLAAARIALAAGAHMAITDGTAPGALGAFFDGAQATWFRPALAPLTARKAWIAATLAPKGKLALDAGALAAVEAGRSLLAVGVTHVEGAFERGDAVRILAPDGASVGIGPDVLIHRDNLVLHPQATPAQAEAGA